MSIAVSTFYRFTPLTPEAVDTIQRQLEDTATVEDLRGLCLLGTEGINATVSGRPEKLERFKQVVRERLGSEIIFKDSLAPKHPFQVFKVKTRREIVSLGNPDLVPPPARHGHMTPAEWHAALLSGDAIVLDTRNGYEVDVGKFRGAVDFRLKEFNEFPDRLAASGIDKNKTILMYCTGGIRCEKALLEAERQGFHSVHQLEGGILNYLAEFPNQDFDGECFIFDYRVALDQNLKPTSRYSLCPHCGQPAASRIVCSQCGRKEAVCASCFGEGLTTCSKNCAHHAEIGSGSRKPHVQELKKRRRIFG